MVNLALRLIYYPDSKSEFCGTCATYIPCCYLPLVSFLPSFLPPCLPSFPSLFLPSFVPSFLHTCPFFSFSLFHLKYHACISFLSETLFARQYPDCTQRYRTENFMVLSLAWRWLFMSKHVALTYAFIIQLCWLEYISIKWTYRINTQRDDFVQIVRRRLSVVCVVTTLWSGETWLRFPTEAITFSLLKNVQTWYGANPTP